MFPRSCSLRASRFFIIAALALCSAGAQPAEKDFRSLFNGSNLAGWKGDDAFWSVIDGAITGQTTAERPAKGNTFLIWQGGDVKNFELRAEFRLLPNNDKNFANSGIQYRSKVVDAPNWVVAGYQADMDGEGKYIGMLYEEKGRGIVAMPGQQVRISAGGEKPKIDVIGVTTPPADIVAAIRRSDWNEYVIIANGNRLRHFVNGLPTADVTDVDEKLAANSGVLALQLHAGPPMTVQYRKIRLKVLP
jgi:hypothetical protein